MSNPVSSTIKRTLTGIIATTEILDHLSSATQTTSQEMVAGNSVLAIHKPAGVSVLAATWQGSVDLVDWVSIGAEQSASGAINSTFPWRYIRCNATTVTKADKTADSVTQAAGIATFTEVAHGFVVGDWVTISGANQAGYNGLKQILTRPSADTFTFAVDAATVTPATGTVLATPMVTFKIGQ